MKIVTLIKNQCKRIEKVVMSITKFSSKIYKPLLYDKIVNNLIHGRRQGEAIEKELQNLEDYQIWEYDKLSPRWKIIRLKWVFKVKYHPNDSVTRFKTRFVTQGFSQIHGIDFLKIFVLIVKKESLQIYLALCLILNLFIY